MADISTTALLFASFGFFFAGVVKGGTGLGFSTTCLPFLVLSLGLEHAMPLVLVPSLTSNFIVHIQAGEFRRTARTFWPMFAALIPGLALGLWLLAHVDLGYASAVLGGVLIVYGVWALKNIEAMLPKNIVPALRIPAGLLGGLINGLTGSQIMPVLPYLLSQPLERNIFLQAINTSFTISSLIMVAGLATIGFLTTEIALLSTAALLPMFAGVSLGARIRAGMTTDTFRKAVLVVLIGLGGVLVFKNLV